MPGEPLGVHANPRIESVRDLNAYRAAVELQRAVFRASKTWPREESYALIDQIRRSSRSIGANLSEAWAKRRYPAHFLSKLTDADGELLESEHWILTAADCGYVTDDERKALESLCREVGRRLGAMIVKYEKFCARE